MTTPEKNPSSLTTVLHEQFPNKPPQEYSLADVKAVIAHVPARVLAGAVERVTNDYYDDSESLGALSAETKLAALRHEQGAPVGKTPSENIGPSGEAYIKAAIDEVDCSERVQDPTVRAYADLGDRIHKEQVLLAIPLQRRRIVGLGTGGGIVGAVAGTVVAVTEARASGAESSAEHLALGAVTGALFGAVAAAALTGAIVGRKINTAQYAKKAATKQLNK